MPHGSPLARRRWPAPAALALLMSLVALAVGGCASAPHAGTGTDPLPAWREGASKQSIVEFVEAVTTPGSPSFVPVEQRIAVFDNDGTLWVEQPVYTQLVFAIDRVKALAPSHPEWRTTQPFKAVLENDTAALAASGENGVAEIVMATHAGMTTAEFESIARQWIETARHPRFGRPYTELVYAPMLDVLAYLRDHGFRTFIVSGGGVEFMRPWTGRVYGIPPEQVIGSTITTVWEMRNDGPVLVRRAKIDFIDDKEGKPIAINRILGVRPIAAFGNSDGDLQMLQWTAAGPGRSLCVIVHHDDAQREWAYDRQSHVGRLDKALDEANERGWTVASMRGDWAWIFPFEEPD